MTPDDHSHKSSEKDSAPKPSHPHQRWQDPKGASQPPRSWTNKTMHHPATRIGEIKHGKS